MTTPVHVWVFTAERQPFLAQPSAAEVAVTLLFEARARGEMRLHGFAVLPWALHLVATPQHISARALLANWMTETESLLRALLEVGGPVWHPAITEEALSSPQKVREAVWTVEQLPVQAGLTGQPSAYRFCSAHGRYQAEVDAAG